MVSDTMNKKLTVEYDEQFDNCQEQEDDWVSSIIGSEDDALYDVLANLWLLLWNGSHTVMLRMVSLN